MTMRKLILEEWVSLDGHVTDKDGGLDFFTSLTADENRYADSDQLVFLDSVDTIILGRKTYELFVEFWPGATTDKEIIADKLNEMPKIVFSNSISEAPWGKWPAAEVVAGDAVAAVKEIKLQPGKDIVLWGSISLAQALITAELVDEYHLQLCPILTGGGRKLFPGLMNADRMKLVDLKKYETGNVLLKYGRAGGR
jgi:dihydrofolate reductase